MNTLKALMKNKTRKDVILTVFFGILSGLLGMVQLDTPGFEGSYSDLREVGLLISIFHLSNPFYIIPLCIISLIGLPIEVRLIPIFIMHVIPLVFAWFMYRRASSKGFGITKLSLIWSLISIIYYMALLYPILIYTYSWFGINENQNFVDSYQSLFSSGTLEMISTALVTSFYLVQLNIRRSLIDTNANLEKIVEQRTRELIQANDELTALNENLEKIVSERTEKIKSQLNQMVKYAHMNSHEVRGPLARILGLLQLLDKEKDEIQREEIIKKINEDSTELDIIIKKMNRILEKEL